MTPHRPDPHPPRHVAAGRLIHALWDAIGHTLQLVLDDLAAASPRRDAAQAHPDEATTCETDRRRRAAGWAAAISAALTDDQLTTAVARLSPPVPGIGRRSAHIARGDLIAWAVAVHRRHPDRPFEEALATALSAATDRGPRGDLAGHSDRPVAATDGDLPEPPTVNQAPPLHARLVAAVQRLEPDPGTGPPR